MVVQVLDACLHPTERLLGSLLGIWLMPRSRYFGIQPERRGPPEGFRGAARAEEEGGCSAQPQQDGTQTASRLDKAGYETRSRVLRRWLKRPHRAIVRQRLQPYERGPVDHAATEGQKANPDDWVFAPDNTTVLCSSRSV